MIATPAISVAIPLYNKAAYIRHAIASALTQSFADFEIIIVDDGSTDDSVAQLTQFAGPRLVLIRQQNSGVAAARNRAMAEARAPLVAFLDADDLWAPDHLLHLSELANRFPQAALFGNRFREFSSRNVPATAPEPVCYALLDDYFSACALGPQPFFTSSCMVRRTEALALGGFPPGQSRGEDLALWMKLAAAAPVAASSYLGCRYRRGSAALTARPVSAPDISMVTLDDLIVTHRGWPESRKRNAREYYYRIALAHALDCARAGDRTAAKGFLQLASETTILRRRLWQAKLLTWAPQPLRNLAFYFKDQRRTSQTPNPFSGAS